MNRHKAQLYIVEARDDEGKLLSGEHTPPFVTASERQLFDYYFAKHPDAHHATWEELRAYFREHKWSIRERYW